MRNVRVRSRVRGEGEEAVRVRVRVRGVRGLRQAGVGGVVRLPTSLDKMAVISGSGLGEVALLCCILCLGSPVRMRDGHGLYSTHEQGGQGGATAGAATGVLSEEAPRGP